MSLLFRYFFRYVFLYLCVFALSACISLFSYSFICFVVFRLVSFGRSYFVNYLFRVLD